MTDSVLREKVLLDALKRGCWWCGATLIERSHYPDCDLLRALPPAPTEEAPRPAFDPMYVPRADEPRYEPWRTVWDVLDAVVAEWDTDPMSVACFDLRLVARAKGLLKARNERRARRGL